MARVQLPDGCYGLDMADGTKYSGKPGDVVTVEGRHSREINKSYYRGAGILRGDQTYAMGTKTARVCVECTPSRRWNAWNAVCPRCGAPTQEEEIA
jgi:hypothetical protein